VMRRADANVDGGVAHGDGGGRGEVADDD